jgi:hypothetical protein
MYIPERIGIPYRCFSWYIEKWWLDRFCEYIIVGILIAGIPVFLSHKSGRKNMDVWGSPAVETLETLSSYDCIHMGTM